MIPYFQFTEFSFGGFSVHVWGVFAAIGFLVGAAVAAARAKRVGIDPNLVWNAATAVVIASFMGSRLFEVLFYEPAYYWAHPLSVLKFWDGGLSSTGGIIGAGLFIYWFIKKHRLPMLQWLDVFAYAAPLGLMVGRIGCFLINDHPGRLTNFFLGVKYPDGVRHDGGLEMAIADGVIFIVMMVFARMSLRGVTQGGTTKQSRKPLAGSFVLLFLALKGLSRFWLDFYRATDLVMSEARYFGLTPSQYAGIIAVVVVAWLALRSRNAVGRDRIVV